MLSPWGTSIRPTVIPPLPRKATADPMNLKELNHSAPSRTLQPPTKVPLESSVLVHPRRNPFFAIRPARRAPRDHDPS